MRAKDFRQSAWQSLKGKWGVCVLAFLIYDVISGALGALSRYGVGAVAIILIEGPLLIGQSKISLKVARGENAEVGMLFDGFKDFARAFVLHLINTIFIVLWTLLLIIPGIIKSYAYSMSYYILLDDPIKLNCKQNNLHLLPFIISIDFFLASFAEIFGSSSKI